MWIIAITLVACAVAAYFARVQLGIYFIKHKVNSAKQTIEEARKTIKKVCLSDTEVKLALASSKTGERVIVADITDYFNALAREEMATFARIQDAIPDLVAITVYLKESGAILTLQHGDGLVV